MRAGDKIGRYELEEPLGEGAMALVFAVRHPVLNRRLALKILKREARHDQQYVTRFIGDAQAAGALEHPHIVRVVDVDDSVETPFIVMELIDGASLDHVLAERGRLPVEDAARIGREVASALAAAHEAGIVHRDIKPSNIMVERRTGTAKLTDFGAAKREQAGGTGLTFHGQLIGTPRYMAPEQIEGGAVDGRADIFALGATMYETLAGKPAFEGDGLATVLAGVLHREPTPLTEARPEVPPGLASLVGTMLAKAPDGRPSSAAAVAAALRQFAEPAPPAVSLPLPIAQAARPAVAERVPSAEPAPPRPAARSEPPPSTAPPAPPRAGRRPPALVLGGAAALALLLAGAGAWLLLAPDRVPPDTTTPPDPAQQPPLTAAAVKAALSDLLCLAVVPEVEGSDRVHLEGSVGAAEIAAEAERRAAALPGVRTVDNDLVLAEAPGCHAAYRVRGAVGGGVAPAPTVTLNRPDGVYPEKAYLVVDVQAPAGFGGLLHVDVFNDQGETIHLLPEERRTDNALAPGGRLRIGVEETERRSGVRYWQSAPPFGPAYIVAVLSERPLYRGLRKLEEPLAGYLDVLLKALNDPATGRKAAVAVRRIEFRAR